MECVNSSYAMWRSNFSFFSRTNPLYDGDPHRQQTFVIEAELEEEEEADDEEEEGRKGKSSKSPKVSSSRSAGSAHSSSSGYSSQKHEDDDEEEQSAGGKRLEQESISPTFYERNVRNVRKMLMKLTPVFLNLFLFAETLISIRGMYDNNLLPRGCS